MNDPYLYPDSNVLTNLLNITDSDALNLAEAELSSANMMLLYDAGFSEFNATCLLELHHILFADIYEWAGKPRSMNIQKREKALAGRSVWYSNSDDILRDLMKAWSGIEAIDWSILDAKEFAIQMAHTFPPLWQVHPFREGNTRTVVMLMALFTEHCGFYFDHDLIAASAGYMRDALVLASIGDYAEYEHLERILTDAICIEPIPIDIDTDESAPMAVTTKYERYYKADYKPEPHEYRPDEL